MNERTLELTQLRSFVVLAELLHFGHAAAALHIAQPALSQQIRKLEAELGFSLFNRTTRKVTLTPAAESFLRHVQGMFGDLDRAVRNAQDISSGSAGVITVGYVSMAMLTVLPNLLRRFRDKHRDVSLQLRELSTAPQLELLRRGDIDVAIVSGGETGGIIVASEIARDRLVAVVPAKHAAAGKKFISASALRADPFIIFPRSQAPQLHEQILSLCRKAGFEPMFQQEVQSWHAIGELVGAGMGVAIAPASVERYAIRNARCVPLRPTLNVSVSVCFNRENNSPLVQQFVAEAKLL